MRLELDKKALFALASDTRLEILKSLQTMRRTVTQLSHELGIDKAAVFRHLKKLEEGEFVKRYEDHGFVYYGLTWKARDLLDPKENTRIVILISSAWAFLVGALLVLAIAFAVPPSPLQEMDSGSMDGVEDRSLAGGTNVVLLLVSIVLGGAGIYLIAGTLRSMRRPRQPPLTEE
jgi:DNA-binding transcriptional ArsR family regulator